MPTFLLLLPDVLLIGLGFALARFSSLERGLWNAVERLVYYLLFPVLLFGSILKSPLDPGTSAQLVAGGLAIAGVGMLLAFALGLWPGIDRRLHASGAQVAFRFNSYVALALAERLAGPAGVAGMALLVAFCVPVCNVAAVWPLARAGGHRLGRELLRNPLIIATVGGLLANLAGLSLPRPLTLMLQRIGGAALPLGLMAVGAGLQLAGVATAPALAGALLAIRHLALPAAALGLLAAMTLPPLHARLLLAFAAMPTASSAYVLAVRMGDNGPFVAGLVTLSTLIGMLSLPLWLMAN